MERIAITFFRWLIQRFAALWRWALWILALLAVWPASTKSGVSHEEGREAAFAETLPDGPGVFGGEEAICTSEANEEKY